MRYRLFRILESGRTVGYVVINESPKSLIVAQCDATNARTLAYGVLLSILQVGQGDRKSRTVVLATCHPEMRDIFQKFGFRPENQDRPFYVGTLHGPAEIGEDTSDWLVNYDWGDNGMRPPFLDQSGEIQDAEAV